MTAAQQHRFQVAGLLAAQAFRSLEAELKSRRTDGRHALENTILDGALMEAGIIPRDPIHSLVAELELCNTEWEWDPRIDSHIRPA